MVSNIQNEMCKDHFNDELDSPSENRGVMVNGKMLCERGDWTSQALIIILE